MLIQPQARRLLMNFRRAAWPATAKRNRGFSVQKPNFWFERRRIRLLTAVRHAETGKVQPSNVRDLRREILGGYTCRGIPERVPRGPSTLGQNRPPHGSPSRSNWLRHVGDPFRGVGKPEPLCYVLEGCRSRRITQEHRLVYRVTDHRIDFLQARYHYRSPLH